MQNQDVDIETILAGMQRLQENHQTLAIFYFLLYLFATLDMDVPFLFMQLPACEKLLACYIAELIEDIIDCALEN